MVGWFTRLKLIGADSGYARELVGVAKATFGRVIEIVKETAIGGLEVLPRRWIVEHAFAWLNKYRCLGKGDEHRPANIEAMIRIAMINLRLHGLEPG